MYSMLPWNRDQFLLALSELRAPGSSLKVTMQVTNPSSVHEFSILPIGEWEVMLGRALGCLLVAAMPASGLKETLDSLREIYEFTLESSRYPLPRPTTVTSKGKVASVSKAPLLTIEEG